MCSSLSFCDGPSALVPGVTYHSNIASRLDCVIHDYDGCSPLPMLTLIRMKWLRRNTKELVIIVSDWRVGQLRQQKNLLDTVRTPNNQS